MSQATVISFLLNHIKTSKQIILELWPCMYQVICWYVVFLYWSVKSYSCFGCVFICSYNWEMCKESAFFCSVYLSDIDLWFPHKLYALLVSWRVAFLYDVIFFLHHCTYLINKCLGVSSMEKLLNTITIMFYAFFYHFKHHLISKTHHLLSHLAWNIFYIPKFEDGLYQFPSLPLNPKWHLWMYIALLD